jgi:hypothetical protein
MALLENRRSAKRGNGNRKPRVAGYSAPKSLRAQVFAHSSLTAGHRITARNRNLQPACSEPLFHDVVKGSSSVPV